MFELARFSYIIIINFNFLEFVVSLNASDEFLRNRVMNLPEASVSGTHNTEEGLQRRLVEYRNLNTDDETVLNNFDELEIHPEHIGKKTMILIDLFSRK